MIRGTYFVQLNTLRIDLVKVWMPLLSNGLNVAFYFPVNQLEVCPTTVKVAVDSLPVSHAFIPQSHFMLSCSSKVLHELVS